MSFMKIEKREDISILSFSHGVTNAMGVEFIAEFESNIQEISHDPSIRAMALASSNDKFFSIGLNIPELIELSRGIFQDFYHAFTRSCIALLSMPKPVIAVISGHAIAGGCILALSCDYRMMAEGRKWIGLNEVKLGLPVPYVATVTLRNLVGYRMARDLMDEGEFCPPERALEIGLVDDVLPVDRLLSSAIERLKGLIVNPPIAYALIKQTRVQPLVDQIQEGMEEIERDFLDSWFSPVAQSLLREAIAKY